MFERSKHPAGPDQFWLINATTITVGFLFVAVVLIAVSSVLDDIVEHAWIVLAGLGALVLLSIALATQRVVVDVDGVSIRTIFGRRFIAHRRIDRVHWRVAREPLGGRRTQELVINPSGGGDVILSTSAAPRIAASIRIKKHQPRDQAESSDGALARAGRGTAEWLRALRALAPKHGSYRSPGSSDTGLWSVVESRWTAPVDRAAAAVALRYSLEEPSRRRLRMVATQTEDQALRLLIEQAADEETSEVALAQALEQVERTHAS